MIGLISAVAAVLVVILLKYLGHNTATVIGGGVAGGIASAVSTKLLKTK
jgi:membrane-associated phospholipid phosphatase